jgi:hypothetical protein
MGSAKANGREPKTGLGRFFNFKLGCFDDVCVLIYAHRFSPVSLSLSMPSGNKRSCFFLPPLFPPSATNKKVL